MRKITLILLAAFIVLSFTSLAMADKENDIVKTCKYKDNTYIFKLSDDLKTLDFTLKGWYANILDKQIGTSVLDFWPVACPYGAVVVWKLDGNNYPYCLITYKGEIDSQGYLYVDKYPVGSVSIKALDNGARATVFYETGGSKDFDLTFRTKDKEI